MSAGNLKQEARDLIDNLPDNATWDDVVYEMVVRREIELGLQDSDQNKITSVEDMLKEFEIEE
jgi:hypothetical protein